MSERGFSSILLDRLSRQRTKTRPYRKLLVWAALAAFGAGAAAVPAVAQMPAPVYLDGYAVATINVTFNVAPPAGSAISCSLSLISNDPRGPSDTNSTTAPVNGTTAVCNITMYYYWRLTSGSTSSDTMLIAYSVQGPTQTSSGVVGSIAMPANGSEVGPMTINIIQ